MKREIKVNIDITSRLHINKLFAVVADGLRWVLGAGGARCSGQCKLPEATPWLGRVLSSSNLLGRFQAQAGSNHYQLVRPAKETTF